MPWNSFFHSVVSLDSPFRNQQSTPSLLWFFFFVKMSCRSFIHTKLSWKLNIIGTTNRIIFKKCLCIEREVGIMSDQLKMHGMLCFFLLHLIFWVCLQDLTFNLHCFTWVYRDGSIDDFLIFPPTQENNFESFEFIFDYISFLFLNSKHSI